MKEMECNNNKSLLFF